MNFNEPFFYYQKITNNIYKKKKPTESGGKAFNYWR